MSDGAPEFAAIDDAPNPFDLPYDDRSPLARVWDWALASFRGGRGLSPTPAFGLASAVLVGAAVFSAVGTTVLVSAGMTSWASLPLAIVNGSGVNTVTLLIALWVLTLTPASAMLVRVARVLTAWALISCLPSLATVLYELTADHESDFGSAYLWSSGLEAAAVLVVCIACLAATSRARPPETRQSPQVIPI